MQLRCIAIKPRCRRRSGENDLTTAAAPGSGLRMLNENAPVLVADIGGTNARFALATARDGEIILTHQTQMSVSDFTRIDDAIAVFLQSAQNAAPCEALLAVAGPVRDGVAQLTNAAWTIDARVLASTFAFTGCRVVNDFSAQAWGALSIPRERLVTIFEGDARMAPSLVLGPGTGLGLALLIPRDGGDHDVLATEAGHIAFAATTPREIAVRAALAQSHGYVSVEHIVSGPGLARVYAALCALDGVAPAASAQDGKAVNALRPTDARAQEALDLILAALGQFAGDAVLMTGATGGVVLTGGMLAAVAAAVPGSGFGARFYARGAMSPYLAKVPVQQILAPDAPLYGAAALALRRSR